MRYVPGVTISCRRSVIQFRTVLSSLQVHELRQQVSRLQSGQPDGPRAPATDGGRGGDTDAPPPANGRASASWVRDTGGIGGSPPAAPLRDDNGERLGCFFGTWESLYMCGQEVMCDGFEDEGQGRDGARGGVRFEAYPEEYTRPVASVVDVDGGSRHAPISPAPPECHDADATNKDADAGSERRVAAEHAGVGEDCAKPEKEAENEVREEKAHKVAFAATLSAMSIDAFGDLACAEFAAGVATGLGVPRGGVRVTSAGARAGSDFVEIIVHANDESNNASATGLTYDDITKSAPPHLRCVVSLFPLCHSSSGAPPSLQAETSKKPTAVDTAPRHRVRKTLSTASFFGRSVKFCCD